MGVMRERKPSGQSQTRRDKSAWVPDRPDKRGAAPALLADVLVGAESYLAHKAGAAIPRAEWTAIVGPRIAGRTRVGKLKRGILAIKVASSSWSNELSFLKSDLLRKLQKAGHEVTELRFYVDNIADDLEPHKHRLSRVAPPLSENTQLPTELLERLRKVGDPNLRAVIAEAARASLRNKEKVR